MKALLICPADRPPVCRLADDVPLAIAPLLGKSVLEFWIETLAGRGAKRIVILASDRPNEIRGVVGDGTRWGVRAEVIPTSRELSVPEARAKYRPMEETDWVPDADVVLVDRLPGQPDRPLFNSYALWFEAVKNWMPHAVTPGRIGMHEAQPGIWLGLHAQIAPTAQLHAPCWIGDETIIGADAVVGPDAIIDDRVVVEPGARVVSSYIAPETFVGRLVSVERSIAHGSALINWQTDSSVHVPDAFLLSHLDGRRFEQHGTGLLERAAALLAMVVTAPFAVLMIALSIVRGDAPLQLRLGLRPQRTTRRTTPETFAFYELTSARSWLRRWPQFWNVVCGDLAWIGNRPLRPTEAMMLINDFERLWLTAPVGLISLADARGCPEGVRDEACAHASFYAVNASRRLDWFIFSRSLLRAAMAWPIWWHRRRDAAVPLPQLAPGQES
jgi:hypothetical protein